MVVCLVIVVAVLFGDIAFAANTIDYEKLANDKAELIIAKEIKTKDTLVDYNVQIPKVQGLKDTFYQEQLNDSILNKALRDMQEVENQAKEHKVLIEKEGRVFRQYEIFIDFALKSNNDILSFVINTYMYTGGANAIFRVDCYNIDVEKSTGVEIKDLFKEDADYKKAINEEISAQIAAQEENENVIYFKEENEFKTISEKQDFYIRDGNLVILFQKYDIAPGYMGTPEFEIPLLAICDLLQYKYIFSL